MRIVKLKDILEPLKASVVTIGMFDGVHIGHQQMLKELVAKAKELSYASVVITFENHPKSVLPSKDNQTIELLQTNEERFTKIASFGVDYIATINFDKQTSSLSAKEFLDYISPKLNVKVLILGYDNRFGNPKNGDFQDIISHHRYKDIEVIQDKKGVYLNSIEVSSTKIRSAIRQADMPLACKMLGENYHLSGTVVKGLQNGQKLGFPTANILPQQYKIIPKEGVYATKIILDNQHYIGITNIGQNPTFNAKNKTIETHILNFNGNIYSKWICIEFVKYLREDKRFESSDALKEQIKKDILDAKNILL